MSEDTPEQQVLTGGGTPSQPEDQGVGPDVPPRSVEEAAKKTLAEMASPPRSVEDAAKEAVVEYAEALSRLADHPDTNLYLPSLVANEFAIQHDSARDMVLMGVVELNGAVWDPRPTKGWIDRHLVLDAVITVKSDVKSVSFVYRSGNVRQ